MVNQFKNMKDIILNYYQTEKSTAIVAILIGLLFITAGSILLWKYRDFPLQKGLMYVFFVAGLFFSIGGYAYKLQVDKSLMNAELLPNNDSELHKTEKVRINKVLASSYTASLIWFTALILAGLCVRFISPKEIVQGVGIGLILFGTVGHLAEAFSIQSNKSYKQILINLENE